MNDSINRRLGDFEIVRELGRGGMGIVYEARQVSLNRRVALKVLSSGLGITSKAVQRFQREAEAAAKLHHTNIVPVYAIGEADGTHFYAMELIDGPSLDHVIRRMRVGRASQPVPGRAGKPVLQTEDLAVTGPYVQGRDAATPASALDSSSLGSGSGYFDAVARMAAEVADALEYAHQQGVIHRDIKPSNLLLSPASRVSVNDFGLARMLEQPGMTMTGEFVGTPAYMSPEQITAGRIPLDHRTDIYSLGATLYELLTLEPPHTGQSREQVLAQIVQKDPKAPRRLRKNVPLDLETICLKCLEKDPDRRYQTAGTLAEDLRRYLNRFAIAARRAGPLTRAKKWVKRNPALSVAGLVILLALTVAGFFGWRAHQSEQQRQAEEQLREQQALAERRRAAIERGMMAALAADLITADKAVAEAELLEASAGETRLLKGFIALYSGRSAEARPHLEQAVRLMPESIAARSLLAYAFAAASEWEASARLVGEAAALTPRTPEDKLFLGHALGTLRPAEGLPLMDQALAERSSGIGHVLRANIRVRLAKFTGSAADAEVALVDAELAKRLLPGNAFSLSVACDAHLVAAIAYRKAKRPDKSDEQMTDAGREFDALAKFPKNYWAVQARHDYARVPDGLNPRADMIAEFRQARVADPGTMTAFFEAYDLFCLGRDAEAAEMAHRFPRDPLIGRIRFLLALGRRDGRDEARRAWKSIKGPDRTRIARLGAAPLGFAVGSPDEVAVIARQLRASGEVSPYVMFNPTGLTAILAFLEGTASEADLLDRPASNEHERSWRHCLIGWKRLGAGNREGAKSAFQKTYEVMRFESGSWWFARAILIRMKDPDWPQAIPKK